MKQASIFLKATLDSYSKITEKVGNRIYPIAASGGVNSFPFIAFEHSSAGSDDTKDGKKRTFTATISCIGKDALQAEELADIVLEACADIDNEAYGFDCFNFQSEDEAYSGDVDLFIVSQKYTFETL